jgi:hypothetical protein
MGNGKGKLLNHIDELPEQEKYFGFTNFGQSPRQIPQSHTHTHVHIPMSILSVSVSHHHTTRPTLRHWQL